MADETKTYVNDPTLRQKDVSETMWTSIKGNIKDRKAGWGKEQAMAVINDIVTADEEYITANKELSPEAQQAIALFINPSATRQWLESKDVALLDKVESAKAKTSAWLKTVK